MKFRPIHAACIFFVLAAAAQDPAHPVSPAAEPALKITPTSLDFGAQSVGAAGPAKTATVTNTTASPITIEHIIASGIDYDQSNNCGTSLAAGAQCAIQVTFKPAIIGPRLGNLTVIADVAPGAFMIGLNGAGK